MQQIQLFLSPLLIAFMMISNVIFGQCADIDDIEDHSAAYSDTHYAAHWSAYVPIAAMAAAAIWLGLADNANNNLSNYSSSSSSSRRSYSSHCGSYDGRRYSSYSKYGSYTHDRSSSYSFGSRGKCKSSFCHH